MTAINVKEIEDLSKRLRKLKIMDEVGSNNPLATDSADALDSLLAFYKESMEQEPVACLLQRMKWLGGENYEQEEVAVMGVRPDGRPLFTLPPSAALAEHDAKLLEEVADSIWYDQSPKNISHTIRELAAKRRAEGDYTK